MGITSTLFHDSNDSDRQTLHRRITPTEDQFQEQQERWNLLADYLIEDLRNRSNCQIRTWLQGSYKFGTQVRPPAKGQEFDIDLGVYFEWKGGPEEGDHSPIVIKEMVQESLNSYTGESVIEVSPPKTRCSRIRFQGDFHIDVPSYHLDPSRNVRALATEADEWENSDPKALYLWFKDTFSEYNRAKVRRQIRYVKCWASLKVSDADSRPSSTLLTILVAEAFQALTADSVGADDDALLAVLDKIVERLRNKSDVLNPINASENLTGGLTTEALDAFLDGLVEFRDIAQRALDCNSELAAATSWAEAFAHFMPLPELDLDKAVKTTESKSLLPTLLNVPDVRVQAVSRTNSNFKWESTNRIGPIPKDCTITFTIVDPAKLPRDAVVTWTVRNAQEEAEDTNDLGHGAGTGFVATERSAYKGTHYMDCVVTRYGQLIGIRRIPVEISGTFVPRRNPQRKPFWRGIVGRR